MRTALLKQSHRLRFLEVGHFLALHFYQGYACFQITGRRFSGVKPYSLGALAALGNLVDGSGKLLWNQIQDASKDYYLSPWDQNLIFHSFWGVMPAQARIFTQFPPTKNIGNLVATDRDITGDVGYVDGFDSSFEGPFSEETELFTVYQIYSQYQAYNPTNDAIPNAKMTFDVAQYQYNLITDPAMIKRMMVGDLSSRIRKFDMGPAYPDNMNIPNWLLAMLQPPAVTQDLLKYSLSPT